MGRDGEVVFIDSSVLISCGRRDGTRFQALAREARQREAVFRISPQVYAEVTGDPVLDAYSPDQSPVDEAVQEGWMKVTESPAYSDSDVSTVMDRARNFIANSSDRSEDVVEKADTEIVGLALETLLDGAGDRVLVVTNDIHSAKQPNRYFRTTDSTTSKSPGSPVANSLPNSPRISSPSSTDSRVE